MPAMQSPFRNYIAGDHIKQAIVIIKTPLQNGFSIKHLLIGWSHCTT